jgi:2,3-bisphosphoglycerate-dependent phosphoglycerate mutase
MAKLVLVRHGKSVWNLENRFTGWVDVDLSEKGVDEAIEAGKRLKRAGLKFDVAFSSMLKRAIKTGYYILEELDMLHINHLKDWRFNERHYGGLTGMNKDEVKAEVGEEQFLVYRRSYDTPPPALSKDSKWHPIHDEKYKNIDPNLLPSTESLKDNQARAMAAFHEFVAPLLVEGKDVLITAHGNTIRGMAKELDGISDEDISKFEIQTGIPRVYEFDEALHIQKVYNITE